MRADVGSESVGVVEEGGLACECLGGGKTKAEPGLMAGSAPLGGSARWTCEQSCDEHLEYLAQGCGEVEPHGGQ